MDGGADAVRIQQVVLVPHVRGQGVELTPGLRRSGMQLHELYPFTGKPLQPPGRLGEIREAVRGDVVKGEQGWDP
jgi:hypothetical protein